MNEDNLHYLEAPSMRMLHVKMDACQKENTRFLSFNIQKDGNNFCCIALAGKTEVVICDPEDDSKARVTDAGSLRTWHHGKSEVVICDPMDDDKARVSNGGGLQIWSPYKLNVVICDPNGEGKAEVNKSGILQTS
ncbi:MAG: hypothetical protein Q7S86_04080 [bacterium]|nr:hypothetical protein [bacterium]